MTLIVGIPACSRLKGEHVQHATPARYGEAALGAAGLVPLLIPPIGAAALGVLDRLDGLLLSGSPSNVQPARYGGGASETPDCHDPDRDATTLGLIRAAIERGLPVLGICRGIQELNVALGGSLHQRVHALPGRLDHRGGDGPAASQYAPSHAVALSGELARLLGSESILVNSVHGQAIDRPGAGLVVEALAPDGTIEAVRLAGARGFVLGVQWHPEWNYAEDPASLALFAAFGAACRAYAAAPRLAA